MSDADLWESFKRRTVFGFHGNIESRIAHVEEHGFHREGLPGDWLGRGFYFWQDAPFRAWQWADDVVKLEARKNPEAPEEQPVVLMVELEYTDDWIDLLEAGPWFDRMRRAAVILERRGALPNQSADPAASVLHERDFAVIRATVDAARLADQRVDAIRCAFIEGTPIGEQSAIYDRAHVQIAVRETAIIRNHSRMIDRPDNSARS